MPLKTGMNSCIILLYLLFCGVMQSGCFAWKNGIKKDTGGQGTCYTVKIPCTPENFVIKDCTISEAFTVLYNWYQGAVSPEDYSWNPMANLTVLPNHRTTQPSVKPDEYDPFYRPTVEDRSTRTVDLSGLPFMLAIEKIASAFDYVVVFQYGRFLIVPKEELQERFGITP